MEKVELVEIIQNPKLGLEVVPGKGRGVYALEDIKKGEVLEHCPAIPLTKQDLKHLGSTSLDCYALPFFGQAPFKDTYALVGGYGLFYNHDDAPNAEYESDTWLENNHIITFSATRDILAGEPITIDYGGGAPVTWDEDGNFNVEED